LKTSPPPSTRRSRNTPAAITTVWFWVDFIDYQNRRHRPNSWSNAAAGEAWGRGMEAAMRVRLGRKPAHSWSEYDRDDCDSLNQIAGLRAVNEKRKKERDEAATWARVVEPGEYPRLHLTGGRRAGRVGADRFRGRYVPHLVVDNADAE
jgi:hypothetical protein